MVKYQFNLDEYLKELESIVNQDSGSDYPEGVDKIADFFKRKYLELGWMVKKHYLDDSVGPCLEIRNKDVDNFDILFIGHMDTVFPEGAAAERPFRIEGGRAYGPGVIDMKSGLLSLYYVMKELDVEMENMPSLCILMNSDEEISSKYSVSLIEKLAKKSRYAFVLEAARTNGALVSERKGLAKYKIKMKGVAAHAGVEPEKGVSAINELGHWIVKLHQLTDLKVGTTVNVGVISGGTKANVVAETAFAKVDVRFKTKEEGAKIENKINELMQNPKTEGIKVEVNKTGYRPPMNPTDKADELFTIIEDVGAKLNIDIKWAATGGGSDANFASAVGTPSIDGLGPIGGKSHSASEYLEIDTVKPRFNLLKEIVKAVSWK